MEQVLKQIADYQMLNGYVCSDYSLMEGKMGIVLFFLFYARHTGNSWYEEFATDLLDEAHNHLSVNLPINFAYGFCGIGWGIEFMKKQGFLEDDTDEILADIDKRIMEYDLRKISDCSFQTGLEGIVMYVRSRLDSFRDIPNKKIFDPTYLNDLEDACQRYDIKWRDELYDIDSVWDKIMKSFAALSVMDSCDWRRGLAIMTENTRITLEEETAILCSETKNLYEEELSTSSKKCLFIISEESMAGKYGVGTYIRQLTQCFDTDCWDINIVTLHTYKQNVQWKMEDRISFYYFPMPTKIRNNNTEFHEKNYYKSVFFYLASRFVFKHDVYCHFNFVFHYDLAMLFKQQLQAKIVFTLHYTDWGSDLLGDSTWLKRILFNPQNKKDERVSVQFLNEKKFMLECCDYVIAIAEHSYKMLEELYCIPNDKLVYVPNGLKDSYNSRTKDELLILRKKYGFKENEKLILFAGRLDLVKGFVELIEAVKAIRKEVRNIKLIIAGDGNFTHAFNTVNPNFSEFVFTGFIPQEQLYELYAIADVGVVPSKHEEFGYVAAEMMMHKLPIIVNNTTGLKEMVENGKYGIIFSYGEDGDISALKKAIIDVISKDCLDKQMVRSARNKVVECYSLNSFCRRIVNIYSCMENPCGIIN